MDNSFLTKMKQPFMPFTVEVWLVVVVIILSTGTHTPPTLHGPPPLRPAVTSLQTWFVVLLVILSTGRTPPSHRPHAAPADLSTTHPPPTPTHPASFPPPPSLFCDFSRPSVGGGRAGVVWEVGGEGVV